ncbi:MAG: protease modulator HflC [Thermotogae bacterium]|nr:protease modulator HflC [Thermotogota bacterium]
MKKLIIFAIVVVAAIFILSSFFFTVDQAKQAVVLRFGEITRVIKNAGLYTKSPFIDKVVYLEKRIINYDIQPEEIITSDQKRLLIDNYALWKIEDPKLFVESVKTVKGAQMRMDDIVYSYLRDILAKHTLGDIISDKRTAYLQQVTLLTRKALKEFGVYTVDVKIKRADLPQANEQAVYQRMKSDRQKVAAMYRAQGEQRAAQTKAEADKECQIILATAQKRADELKGEGDAKALEIYADAYNRDPEFYRFWRTLQSYKTAIASDTTVILSTDSDYLRFIDKENVKTK